MDRPTISKKPVALETFTDMVLEVYREAPSSAALIVGLSSGSHLEFSPVAHSSRPLVLELAGLVAPAAWDLMAIGYLGLAHTCDGSGLGEPVRGVVALDRDAAVTHRAIGADGSARTLTNDPEPTGAVLAMMRLAMGAPSHAPHGDVVDLWNSRWVERMVKATVDSNSAGVGIEGDRIRFADLAQLHPAVGRRRSGPETPEDLADQVVHAAARTSWDQLHGRARLHPKGGCDVARRIARWADTPAFAMLAERRVPPRNELASALNAVLPPLQMTEVNMVLAFCDETAVADASTDGSEAVGH